MFDHIGPQIVAHRLRIPAHPGQEILHPVRRGIAGRFGQLPTLLPGDRREQTAQVPPSPPTRLDPAKARADPLDQRVQALSPDHHLICPRHARYPALVPCQHANPDGEPRL